MKAPYSNLGNSLGQSIMLAMLLAVTSLGVILVMSIATH
ncbi:hypothetical protein NIES4102_02930 [Chondrocystis sp. NIES-4102]|nr:hypothetical protein NIES4102_02930 [Chondrocystis sp. NIES-4102]